jgi:hypothetical protein
MAIHGRDARTGKATGGDEMNESQLKAKVIKMIREEFPGAWVYKTADRFTSGIPDLIICYCGFFIAIELKTPENKKRNLLQEFNIRDIVQRAQGRAATCRSIDEVREIFRSIKERIILERR